MMNVDVPKAHLQRYGLDRSIEGLNFARDAIRAAHGGTLTTGPMTSFCGERGEDPSERAAMSRAFHQATMATTLRQ